MKKLFIVNNNQEYSAWCLWLVVADPDEWESLETVLLYAGRWGSDRGKTIDGVATEFDVPNAIDPADMYTTSDIFEFGPEPTALDTRPFFSQPDHMRYATPNKGIARRDTERVIRHWLKTRTPKDDALLPLAEQALREGILA